MDYDDDQDAEKNNCHFFCMVANCGHLLWKKKKKSPVSRNKVLRT